MSRHPISVRSQHVQPICYCQCASFGASRAWVGMDMLGLGASVWCLMLSRLISWCFLRFWPWPLQLCCLVFASWCTQLCLPRLGFQGRVVERLQTACRHCRIAPRIFKTRSRYVKQNLMHGSRLCKGGRERQRAQGAFRRVSQLAGFPKSFVFRLKSV